VVPQTSGGAASTTAERLHVFLSGNKFTLSIVPPAWLVADDVRRAGGLGVRAPMPGLIVEVKVALGDVVEPGQALVVLESMKTEIVLRADAKGKVRGVACKKGDIVQEGKELVDVGPEA